MTFENFDKVTAFERLRDALQAGRNAFRVAMHCYFWGRLSAYTISSGSVSVEEDTDFKSKAVTALREDNNLKLTELSAAAETAALSVKEVPPIRLMTVGYWSNVCYFFRYLESSDPKWCAFSADSFLSALDDLDEFVRPPSLHCEMKNMTVALSVAEAISDVHLADDAEKVLRWSSDKPLGEMLPKLVMAR